VLIVVIGPVLGVLTGWLMGGRVRRLGELPLRAVWLIWVAVALQVLQYWSPYRRFFEADLGISPVLVSYAVLAAWLILNVAYLRGGLRMAVTVVTGGWLLNYVVIATNGAMPVSGRALRDAGVGTSATRNGVADGHLFKHELATSITSLRWLGDVVPVRVLHTVVSAGDIVLWLGVIATVAVGMRAAPVDVATRWLKRA
jgi:Family of unknown function (DUF5317)